MLVLPFTVYKLGAEFKKNLLHFPQSIIYKTIVHFNLDSFMQSFSEIGELLHQRVM